jgi:hypothetical protein
MMGRVAGLTLQREPLTLVKGGELHSGEYAPELMPERL